MSTKFVRAKNDLTTFDWRGRGEECQNSQINMIINEKKSILSNYQHKEKHVVQLPKQVENFFGGSMFMKNSCLVFLIMLS